MLFLLNFLLLFFFFLFFFESAIEDLGKDVFAKKRRVGKGGRDGKENLLNEIFADGPSSLSAALKVKVVFLRSLQKPSRFLLDTEKFNLEFKKK